MRKSTGFEHYFQAPFCHYSPTQLLLSLFICATKLNTWTYLYGSSFLVHTKTTASVCDHSEQLRPVMASDMFRQHARHTNSYVFSKLLRFQHTPEGSHFSAFNHHLCYKNRLIKSNALRNVWPARLLTVFSITVLHFLSWWFESSPFRGPGQPPRRALWRILFVGGHLQEHVFL